MVKHVPPLKWERKNETLEIDEVPTVAGLLEKNLARRRSHGVQVSNQGHRLMGDRLRANAQEFIEKGKWRGVSGVHDSKPDQPGVHNG